mmetsp:Transcript_28671/g.61515  ORF Transcript_28671/g.61515 Transcript_28671/m.61515 type:complete len:197 (-) Transcript_28671:364-954(-)
MAFRASTAFGRCPGTMVPLLLWIAMVAATAVITIPSATAFRSARLHRLSHTIPCSTAGEGFSSPSSSSSSTGTELSCGLIEILQDLFRGLGSGGGSGTATASHILVKGGLEARARLEDLKAEIGDSPVKFGDAAAAYSDCSSASRGGDLGEFEKGTMAKEFDAVVFDDEKTPIGVVRGPIQTEFGYHLILVKERSA